jgi:hypothetical protein
MTLLERNQSILRRIDHLEPIADRVVEVLRAGKRQQLLSGLDAQGLPFAPLARSTLANPRRAAGGPLVPGEQAADLVVHYEVTVTVRSAELVAAAGWPFGFVRWLRTGTRKMPRRDPGGFRSEDMAKAMALLKEHIFG